MSKLTELEVCRKMAELEGLVSHIAGNVECAENHYAAKAIDGVVYETSRPYNPITGKALCFELMVKYGIDFFNINGVFYASDNKSVCVNSDNPGRAICLAILKSKGVEI